jgi:hypothetical protein
MKTLTGRIDTKFMIMGRGGVLGASRRGQVATHMCTQRHAHTDMHTQACMHTHA